MKRESASDVVSQDVAPLTVSTDARPYSRLGWGIVLGGVLGFLIWACVAPLDKGVPVSGTLSVDSNRKAIQHQQGGIVDDVLVKDGDIVKAGQVLVKMNASIPRANFEAAFAQYMSMAATAARLTAERDGAKEISFPADMLSAKNDPKVAEVMSVQRQLFVTRQAALQSELSAADENIAGLRVQIAGLKDMSESKRGQLKLMKEQLDGLRDLSKDGFVARNRLLELERNYLQLESAVNEDRMNMARLERQAAEVALRRGQRAQEFQREVRTQLADMQREADMAGARVAAAKFELNNVEVKSPVDGVVMGVAVFTKGGVVPGGARLMDVVPTADALTVEGEVPVNMIDRVHPDMKVEMMFSAFNTNSTPHIPGVITTVSADRFVNEHNGAPYYKLKAKVTPEGMRVIAARKLQLRPGMPVEVFVHTGERTMMNYLLKPIFDRAKTSMSEE
ncbi:HlyD family type I secretion periplasmic adaptor subunit [Massilia sp. TS11]|uniref:HlyD family type I secretion periplasmic adaptor subunit n=1 Tax=Massilia sp. TS11 TaxID=2908003 RepID=UPI001EDA4C23|nr:HlyD family type I secretion periplasmic adaptor subunit [Massilia sp. TS11]MCG2583631.1 HlyD family type I secretion periplasmic adaptor subunit [Massilia sp. TS11]